MAHSDGSDDDDHAVYHIAVRDRFLEREQKGNQDDAYDPGHKGNEMSLIPGDGMHPVVQQPAPQRNHHQSGDQQYFDVLFLKHIPLPEEKSGLFGQPGRQIDFDSGQGLRDRAVLLGCFSLHLKLVIAHFGNLGFGGQIYPGYLEAFICFIQ